MKMYVIIELLIFPKQPFPYQDASVLAGYPNGLNPQAAESMSPELLAAVRQQMCNMVDAANFVAGFNLPPNMTVQSMTPQNLNANLQNPKVGSPATIQHQLNKNGGEPSNLLQLSRLGSPALHILPTELTVHGLQNLSPNDIDELEFRKKDKRIRKSMDDDFEEHQKALNNSQVSITKTNSPKSNKTLSMESLEPVVNMAMGSTIDMSFKSSRNSNDGSVNGEDNQRSFRNPSLSGFESTSPIKLEPLADCRE